MRLNQPYEKFYSIAFVVIFCNTVYSQYNIPPNPCSTYFSYVQDGPSIIGSVQLDPPQLNEVYTVNVTLSVADRLPSQYPGSLILPGSEQDQYQQVLHRSPLNYKVLFPPGIQLPRLTSIKVNGQEICNGPPDIGQYVSTIDLTHTFRAYEFTYPINSNRLNDAPNYPQSSSNFRPINPQSFFKPNRPPQTTVPYTPDPKPPVRRPQNEQPPIQQPPQTPFVPSQPPQQRISCGIPAVQEPGSIPLVVGGVDVERGSWPWLAAIYRHTIEKQEFICGGNLVSQKAVVTAAHCVVHNNVLVPPLQILIILGRHNRNEVFESGMEQVGVSQIFPHQDYRPAMGYDADIAVIILQNNVEYTDYIRPICIPSMTQNIIGMRGTVAGWGITDKGVISSIPFKVQEPIVSESECVRSNSLFRGLISRRTFCAGDRTGSGPCLGDSGGGFGIYMNGRWMLYGTVSAALKKDSSDCDLDNYVIYCNVSEFFNWLKQYI